MALLETSRTPTVAAAPLATALSACGAHAGALTPASGVEAAVKAGAGPR